MSVKRKISIRKILQLSLTLLATAGCIMAILSASSVQKQKKVAGIDIRIKNSQYHFIDREQVMQMLQQERNIDLSNIKLNKINVHQLESVLDANPWVADAQVYVDAKQKLHVWITQRVPVARIFEQDGNSYYLDETLKAMPLSSQYTHYTTVVTNVPVLKDDSLSNALKAQLVSLVKFIDKDSFWNAQVSQVIVTDDKKFELVPVLGHHRIMFGDTTLMQDKFGNLFAFYKKVLNRIGWDKYETLDVRYASQLVASPALQWKKPADKMMSNMDWVKSIIGNEPVPTLSDTPDVVITNTIVNVAAQTSVPVKPATQPVQAKAAPAPVVQQTKPIAAAAATVAQSARVVKVAEPKTVAKLPVKPSVQPTKLPVAAKAAPVKHQVKTVVKAPAKPVAQPANPRPVAKAVPAKDVKKLENKVPAKQVTSKNIDRKKTDTKSIAQAAAKPVAAVTETPKADKRDKEKNKEKPTNEKSPKYIYQGN